MEPDSASSSEIDTYKFLSVLEDLEKDLLITYRPNYESDLESQLRVALSEISHHRKDLTAIIGICKLLISSTHSNQEKLRQVTKESNSLKQHLQDLQAENLKIKEEVHHIEDKYYEVSHNLEKAEEELDSANSELHKIMRERSKKNTHMSLHNFDKLSAEIFSDIKNQYKDDYEIAVRLRSELEKKCFELEALVCEKDKQIGVLEIRCREFEVAIGEKDKVIEQLEVKFKFRQASTDAESFCSQSRPSIKNGNESIRFDLEEAEFGSEMKNSMENDFFTSTFLATSSKNLEIVALDRILIKAKAEHLQEFTEEIFFNMTLNAAKINMPQFASLSVDSKELYRLAVQGNVPLHKWNFWIESQLNMIHIKNASKCGVGRFKR